MNKTVFEISKMDCPSEENLIRMKLDGIPEVKNLDFDIAKRKLTVFHNGQADQIEKSIDELKLGGKKILINSDWLEPEWSKKITYWNSNLSDEELKSLLIKTVNNGCPSDEDARNSFQKSVASLSSVKNTSKTIPYNEKNDNETQVGEKWQNYIVLGKQYLY
jgi:copper chaperone CopZ